MESLEIRFPRDELTKFFIGKNREPDSFHRYCYALTDEASVGGLNDNLVLNFEQKNRGRGCYGKCFCKAWARADVGLTASRF